MRGARRGEEAGVTSVLAPFSAGCDDQGLSTMIWQYEPAVGSDYCMQVASGNP